MTLLSQDDKIKIFDKRISELVAIRRSSKDLDEILALGGEIARLVDIFESEIGTGYVDKEELLWYDESAL